MFKTHFSLLLVLSLSAFTRSKDINKIQEFVKWMINHCDPNCESYTFLNATSAIRYTRKDETWILLEGSGGPRGYGSTVGRNAMGLLNFNQPVLEDREVQGTYIYPDWVTCVKGTWKNYILQRGRYCNITNSSNKAHLKLAIDTEEINSPELRYLPPYFNSYGLPPTQADPFEMNTVEVRGTDMRDMDTSADQGEGLFVTRDIKRGELVCFYSGHLVHQDYFHLLNRRMKGMGKKDQMYQKKFSLHVNNKISNKVVIDIPPRYGKIKAYQTTVGHKANHSFRNNAEYRPFQFHPVLGFIEAVVAVKDIPRGSEVFCNYGYSPSVYQATGIFPGDLECSSGKCLEVTSMTKNETLKKPNTSKSWLRAKMNHLI